MSDTIRQAIPARRSAIWLSVGGLVAAVLLFNASVTVPAALALTHDDRNRGIQVFAYRRWGVLPQDITIDLVSIDSEKAPLDLFRVLFMTAASLKGRHFHTVVLARAGREVFRLDGTEFQAIGMAYATGENPVYLIRTFPEKLRTTDGRIAYGSWEGGLLGVLGKQLEDVNSFAVAWLSGDASARASP